MSRRNGRLCGDSRACGDLELVVEACGAGVRVDRYVTERCEALSRSAAQRLIVEGRIRVNDLVVRPSHVVRTADRVLVRVPASEPISLEAESIPLQVVHEDEHLLVVDKPPGMVVHPGAGVSRGTLVNALLSHVPSLGEVGEPLRPGIVHRLDRDTSGLLVVAKTREAYEGLVELFRDRDVARFYAALVCGSPPGRGTVDAPIGRSPRGGNRFGVGGVDPRDAVTHFEVEERFPLDEQGAGSFTLLRVRLETGRTHQIRVHLTHIGFPVAGDPTYGGGSRRASREAPSGLREQFSGLTRQLLHAGELRFEHPVTGEELRFTSPLRADFLETVLELRGYCAGN